MSAAESQLSTGAVNSISHEADQIAYRPDVDGLRAVAALAVVAAHAGWLPGGGFGVDIFFVISGFLISGIIFRSLEQRTFGLAKFYARRAKRIFPALLALLFATWGMGAIILDRRLYELLGQDIAAGAGFTENLWYYISFPQRGETPRNFLGHLWTLGVEEQFYIVWPLFMWLTWKVGRHQVALLGLMVTISFCSYGWTLFVDPMAAWFLPWNRLWELAAGSLLACPHEGPLAGLDRARPRTLRPAVRRSLGWIGAISLVVALTGAHPLDRWPSGYAWLAVVATFVLIASGPQSWVNRHLLAARPMVFIGRLSYPLYLWHFPLFVLAALACGQMSMPHYQQIPVLMKIAVVVASLALAHLTYVYLELPIRSSPHANQVALRLCTVMFLCGSAAYLTSR